MSFKFGLNPGHIPVGLRDLTYYAAGDFPRPPVSVAVPTVQAADGTPWGMDGNDQYGDCGVAGVNHGFMAVDSILDYMFPSPSDQEIVDYYLTYTGGQDSGVVLADFLGYVKSKGFFGHVVEAYAPVAVHDIPTLMFAVDAFDFAYTGITVTDKMMTAFKAGKPWTLGDVSSPVDGGHCVPIVGYDESGFQVVTWGRVQTVSYPCWHFISTEAWAVIPKEFADKNSDGRGINLAALQADLAKINR